jgi:hypothetical protein
MNLLLKILIISLVAVFAQAETTIDSEGTCLTSELLQKTHLSCVSCALKKIGRPVPDDHFLAMFGLIARENTALFDDEKPVFTSDGKTKTKNLKRRDLHSNSSEIKNSPAGPVEFTARAVYQKNVTQMLLASGYCTEGKIKPKQKGKYSNLYSRINSDQFAVGKQVDERDEAFREIGHERSSSVMRDFFMKDSKEKSFLSMSFEEQQEFFKGRRKSMTQRREDSSDSKSDIIDCVNDIDQNYTHNKAQDSYDACRAIFDGCEIGTTPREGDKGGQIYRENKARVGGDWCATKYKVAAAPTPEKTTPAPAPSTGDKNVTRAPTDKGSAAPAVSSQANRADTAANPGDVGVDIDMTQLVRSKDGWFLPNSAIKTKAPAAAVPPAPKPLPGFQQAVPQQATPAPGAVK